MKNLCFICYFLWINTVVFAQMSVEKQLEISLNNYQKDFELMNLGKQGLLVFIDDGNTNKGQAQLTIIKYDTLLEQQWRESYAIDFGLVKQLYSIHNDRLDFLASVTDSIYHVASLDLADGSMLLINCVNSLDLYAKNFNIKHFVSVPNAFIFGGEADGKPTVLYYNVKLAEFKVLPNINYLKANLINISSNFSANIFSILLESKGDFYYNSYDNEGKLLGNNVVKPANKKYKFFSFHPYIKDEKEQYIIGTYSFFLPQPQGVYVAKFVDNKHTNTQFYSFNNFKNFHNHLDNTKREKIDAKANSKSGYKYDYEVAEQKITFLDNQILYVLRVNKPRYTGYTRKYELQQDVQPSAELKIGKYAYSKTEVYTTPAMTNPDNINRNNRRVQPPNDAVEQPSSLLRQKTTARKTIDSGIPQGYIYKNAITCTFDKNGNFLWDNAFDFRSVHNYSNTTIEAATKENHLTLLHSSGGKIYLSKANKNESSKDMYVLDSPIPPTFGINAKQRVQAWYDNHFIFIGLTYHSQTEMILQQPTLKLLKVHATE